MSYLESIPVEAGQDLTAAQYKAITVGGTIASGATAIGILQNKPDNGQDATAGYAGRSRYVAGAGVTAGANLSVTTSGYLITTTSGSPVVGRALAAVSSGGIGEAIINFASGLVIA